MADKPEIVQIKMDKTLHSQIQAPNKALQIKIDSNKSVVVYNHIQGLDCIIKVTTQKM
ncbi:MAG: hypothetical protein ABF920_11605 [Lacticaseibacillus paracasei]|uniref:hypothetical protein n=1 Tax=Lactobacillaceae TaxID=33958 RepID=UPI0021C2F19C|nr:hypothetical protein [Lacticaseibacillus paracasei]MCP9305877.1 hypothetical protein [Lacticaseibacillus paracasei]MCP9311386.1 hypothetical protein [Lacticaseibacillus paracasei]MCP9348119.1 hypothetical protein [Lacticaseibacillus paracasei]MCP9380444.1 hypothetical protein [Lacticaseibacillus paracasei]